jgi:hypothetical protein
VDAGCVRETVHFRAERVVIVAFALDVLDELLVSEVGIVEFETVDVAVVATLASDVLDIWLHDGLNPLDIPFGKKFIDNLFWQAVDGTVMRKSPVLCFWVPLPVLYVIPVEFNVIAVCHLLA